MTGPFRRSDQFLVFNLRSSIFNLQSSILNPQSSILNPSPLSLVTRQSRKRLFWVSAKIVIGLGLLVLLIWKIGLRELYQKLEQVSFTNYLIGLAIYAGGMSVRTVRWQQLLGAVGSRMRLAHLVKLQFVGVFFNQFLPTSLGGDGFRVFFLSRDGVSWEKAVGSVLIERIVGMLMLVILGLVAGVAGYHLYRTTWILGLLAALLVGLALSACILFSERAAGLVLRVLDRLKLSRVRNVFDKFSLGLRLYRSHRGVLLFVMAISFTFQLVVIWLFYFFSVKLGMEVSFWYFLLFVPILISVSQVPIAPNGLGVREWTSVLLFTQVGATETEAGVLSMCYWLLHFGAGVIGGVLFLFSGGRDRKLLREIEEEFEMEEEMEQSEAAEKKKNC